MKTERLKEELNESDVVRFFQTPTVKDATTCGNLSVRKRKQQQNNNTGLCDQLHAAFAMLAQSLIRTQLYQGEIDWTGNLLVMPAVIPKA